MQTISTDATIAFALPPDVTPPKYQMFQQVVTSNRQGVIVGIHYDCPLDAMAQNLNCFGWQYNVSFMFGRSPEHAINAHEIDTFVYEDQLQPLPTPVNN